MAKTKTKETAVDVEEFIHSFVENEQKKHDSFELIKLMSEWSGFDAKMWGPTIIGFGSYHYRYESGHEGDAPMIGFSPRKAEFSLYVNSGSEESQHLLGELGKYKMGKACIYFKKLSDINIPTLKKMCLSNIKFLKERYGNAGGNTK